MQLVVDREFLSLLSKMNISTSRSGMDHRVPKPINRWKLGDILRFDKNARLEPYSTIAAGNSLVSTGSFSTTASNLPFNTILGRYAAVGPGCSAMGFRHPVEAVCMNSAVYNFYRENVYPYFKQYEEKNGLLTKNPVPTPQPVYKPTRIGHDVWFASNITFCAGITVGTGSIVASNSVLTKDVPPYSFVAGVPAKVKKLRFSERIVERLLDSHWWDYELGDLFKYNLNFSSPEEFLDKFEELRDRLPLYGPKSLYPLEYLLRKRFKDLPAYFAITEHLTIFGLDLATNKISQIDSVEDFLRKEIIIPEVSEKGCMLSILRPRSGSYISKINSDLSVDFSSEPNYFGVEMNENGSISLQVNGKFLSFKKGGVCSLVDWNREWEQLFLSKNFQNSILG